MKRVDIQIGCSFLCLSLMFLLVQTSKMMAGKEFLQYAIHHSSTSTTSYKLEFNAENPFSAPFHLDTTNPDLGFL